MSLAVFECTHCGARVFPRRDFCRGCGAARWREVDAAEGTVDETTVVRHRAGSGDRPTTLLASVTTCAGPVVVARLEGPAARGEPVCLRVDTDGAVVAVPRPSRLPHVAIRSSARTGASS